ncbi:MAG: GNAT family N-acetyltransferase [Acidimicrobiales bacterium]
MPVLQRVCAHHAVALLEFEVDNRTYFAAHISDRGDEFFDRFSERFDALLVLPETGQDAYHVLVDTDGSILGRFNLVDIDDGSAELGYRVAERAAGHGVATAAVADVCRIAATELGLRTLRARTTDENVASRRVLAKAGFVAVGEADVAGRPGTRFERTLPRSDRAGRGRERPSAGR